MEHQSQRNLIICIFSLITAGLSWFLRNWSNNQVFRPGTSVDENNDFISNLKELKMEIVSSMIRRLLILYWYK